MILGREFVFHSAHNLTKYNGKCEHLHGHSYKLRVEIEGSVSDNGMVMDFSRIGEIVDEKVISILDHAYINDILDTQSSLERLAEWTWQQLQDALPIKRIHMWETDRNYLIYDGPNA